MTRPVQLRPLAEADLAEIWDHTLAEWGSRQAEAYLAGLGKIFDLLAEHPEIARLRTEFVPPLRLHPYRAHLIIFQSGETLEVIRVVHGRTDWLAFLTD
ncbi:type II toxin-antitoxin system RelE/ParE family toxin [Gemmobacter aquarius]|uniref:Toxin n=1 Tax=Paragemmobacter aquarius TaxID=2169400 RepID=A0A2S0UPW9_9RHOB|nr:type II toxin-antitoxin system RelE/ParE family toxin [Gemmobacter aquarius]AWB49856.1 type II toxin-antitoxin system RelE/ParE family toxin [Gemmobacter aquarius]